MLKKVLTAVLCATSLLVSAQEEDSLALQRHDVVVITGTRESTLLRQLPVTITSINRENIEANYQSSLIPVLTELTPGLFSTSRGMVGYGVSTNSAGEIKIRGVGGGSHVLVVIDGQPQYAGLMGHPIPDAYLGMMAEKVEVLRGPASVLYGSNAMGGVVNILTRKMDENGIRSDVTLSAGSYGTVQAESGNRFRNGKFWGVLDLNYQRTDGHRHNSNFEQETGFAKLGYDFNDKWKASADIDLTHFEFMNPGTESNPLFDAKAKITRGLASVSVSNFYGKTDGTIRAFYDWGHHNINDGHAWSAAPRVSLYKHNDYIGGVTAFQNVRFLTGNNVTFGLDYQKFGGEAWNESLADGSRKDIGNIEDQDETAAYVDIRQAITGLVTADFGIRIDNHSQTGTEIVPQGGITFHFAKSQDIKMLVSKGFANPVIRDMYMFAANPDLEPERMINYEFSYIKRATNGTVGVSFFVVDGENMIEKIPNPSGAGMLSVNTGEFRNHGVEIEGDYTFGRWWTLRANYSYLHMKTPVIGAPEGKFFASACYQHGEWLANVSLENVSGLYINTQQQITENYTIANFAVSYQLIPELKIFVKGENLLAERYQTYEGFWMPKATFMGGIKMEFGCKR